MNYYDTLIQVAAAAVAFGTGRQLFSDANPPARLHLVESSARAPA